MPNPGPSHAPHQQDSRWSSPQIRRLYPELLDYKKTSASEVIERARELSPLHNPSRNIDDFRRTLENITKHKTDKTHDNQAIPSKSSNGRHGTTDTPPRKPTVWQHDNSNTHSNTPNRALSDKTNRHETPNRRAYTSEPASKPPNSSASPARTPPQYNGSIVPPPQPPPVNDKSSSSSKDSQPNTAYDNSRVIMAASPHRQYQPQHTEVVTARQPTQESTSTKIPNSTEQRGAAYCTPSRRHENITPSRRESTQSQTKNDNNSNPSQCFASGEVTKRPSATTSTNTNDAAMGPALSPTIPPPTSTNRSIPVMIPPTANQYVESKWTNTQAPPVASNSPHRYVSPFQRALPQQPQSTGHTQGLPPTSPNRFCSPSRPTYEPQPPPPNPPLRSYSPHHRIPLDNSLEMSPPSSPLHNPTPSQPAPTTAFFTYADPLSPQSRICVPVHMAKPHMLSKIGATMDIIMNDNEVIQQGGPHAPLKIMISSSAPNNIKRQVYSPVNGRSDLPVSPNSNNVELVSPTSCSSPQTSSLVLTNSTSPHSPANPCSVYSPTQQQQLINPHAPPNAIYTNQNSSQGPPMAPLFNSPPNNSHKEPLNRPEPIPMVEPIPKSDNIKPISSRAIPGPSSNSHLVSLSHPSLPGVGDLSTCGVPKHIWKDPSAGSASRPVGSPTPSRNRWSSSTPKDPIRAVVPPFRELTIPMVASLAAPLPADDRWKVPEMSFVNTNAENNERFQNETPSTLEGSMSQPMNSREWVREPASYPRAPSPDVRNVKQTKPQKTTPQSTPDIHWCRHSDDKNSVSSLSSKGSLTVESGRSSNGGISEHLTAVASTSSTQCKLNEVMEEVPTKEQRQAAKSLAPKVDPGKDLYDALVRGVTSKTQLSRYIKAGANPNYRDQGNGDTALIRACELKSTRIMTLFLECPQLELDATDSNGCTALHKCSKLKWLEGMKALINAGASVNCSEVDGKTPLMICCDAGFLNGANLLLTTGALIDMQDCAGRTALQRVNELMEIGVEESTKEKLDHIKDLLTAAAAASVAYD